ncbi:hypothetical protein F7725_012642 [Dissostichus mawsoni]|uniref:Galactosylceramide sulfotransferase-like n=1 Tax=Dissostichus mawsoni TaxID=36200 RepID=A0A7J5YNA1_DISMA|nr:hypothetical protein F7725_012642 [Dissostichus mawsoni]
MQRGRGKAEKRSRQGRQWRSVCKGLVLGTLLTSCMILLYCLSTPQTHFSLPEVPVPYSCAHRPSQLRSKQTTNRSEQASGQTCTPKVDIMFMKTHKTASSTFLNILFRFGEKHRLKFAFPDSRNDFFYPSVFQRSQVKDYRPGMCFNIICNHLRFNAPEVAKLLPMDTSYITILRDPAELFESSFHYFGKLHFEESLILLKDALCWEMDDVLFFKLNARKGSTVSKLTPELRAKALEWNAIDWKLYQHLNQTFWKKVDAYGRQRMAEDVAELRRRNAEMASICIEGGRAVEAGSIQETAMQPWQPIGEKSIMGYNLKKNVDKAHRKLCRKMLMPELQYLTELGVNLWITKLWGHVRDIINW